MSETSYRLARSARPVRHPSRFAHSINTVGILVVADLGEWFDMFGQAAAQPLADYFAEMKQSLLGWRDLHSKADLLKAADKASGGLMCVGAIEVSGAEVLPFGAVAQHVPDGGEHGSGDSGDGFLGATTCAQAVELGLGIAAQDWRGGSVQPRSRCLPKPMSSSGPRRRPPTWNVLHVRCFAAQYRELNPLYMRARF